MTNSIQKGNITLICPVCKNEFKAFKSQRKGITKSCSHECAQKIRPRKPRTMINCVCKECSKEFQIRKGHAGKGEYCSIPCMAAARGRNMSGQKHPKWNGGSAQRTHKSRRVINEVVKERGKCEQCGVTNNLQGHHIKSHSQYPVERTNSENIQVLCIVCHAGKHPKLAKFILAGNVHA